jgi:hypothetical protein
MPMSSMQAYAMLEIDPDEDDVGEDEEEEGFSSGAKGAASTYGATATSVARVGNTVVQQGLGAVGKTANIANFVQTGNVFSVAAGGASAALAPIAAVTGPIGIALALVDSGVSAYAAVKTYRHIKALEHIILTMGKLAKPGTVEAIIFCCKKKNKKLKRKGVGCVPILGSICNTIYTAGRSIQKRVQGTRGVERRQQASILWQNTLLKDPCAIAACKEILGVKIYGMIAGLADGHLVLKKKMKSL